MAKNDKTVSDSDTNTAAENAGITETATPTGATPTERTPMYDGVKTFAYVGPSLPGGRLNTNTILGGTYAEITDYYKETIAEYPGVEKLFVPVSRLAESRDKAAKSGNLVNKHYKEIAAIIKAKGVKE